MPAHHVSCNTVGTRTGLLGKGIRGSAPTLKSPQAKDQCNGTQGIVQPYSSPPQTGTVPGLLLYHLGRWQETVQASGGEPLESVTIVVDCTIEARSPLRGAGR